MHGHNESHRPTQDASSPSSAGEQAAAPGTQASIHAETNASSLVVHGSTNGTVHHAF
jgi:hypothetical protein